MVKIMNIKKDQERFWNNFENCQKSRLRDVFHKKW